MIDRAEIVGHKDQINALEQDRATGNVAHAYLFAGPKHVGKFTIAKWFASSLLTVGIDDEEQKKSSEMQIDRLIHPDLLVLDQLWIEEVCEDFDVIAESSNIVQQHRKQAKAKTDTISIDDVRALQERLFEVKTSAYRVCLIRSVERMQDEAVNAILKILEEPPPGVVFILTTQSLTSLLPTLISRSRVLHFLRLSLRDLQPLLRGNADDDAEFLLRFSQGAPGTLQLLQSDPDLLREKRIRYGKAVSFWQSRSLAERLQILEPLHDRSEEAEEFLLHLALSLREISSIADPAVVHALSALVEGLQTNAHRQLLAQRFALTVTR